MNNELESRQVLIVGDSESDASKIMERAIDRVAQSLENRHIQVIRAACSLEAKPLIETNMDLDAILVASSMNQDHKGEHSEVQLLRKIRERQASVPVFLLADRESTSEHISFALMELANEFVWIFEDSPEFIAGRIEGAIIRFRETLLPPLMKAIWEYNEHNHEYSWAAPGHQGGIGFTKTPAGKKFFDFYGENLFRTDTGIERSSIGSLLDHEGAFGESEKFAAKVFGAHQSYSIVVGTSGSNRTIMQACIAENDLVICDRNCHKSIEEGLILTGAVPVYMIPTRNSYGIIGPIRKSEMTKDAIAKKIQDLPLKHNDGKPVYSVFTNCTYDGLCYNSAKVEKILAESCDRIHCDEAWYGYARFNPMYEDHYAMRGDPARHQGPTVFATHSTHKLLNALSQASYIHVRNGKGAIDFDRFNQAYMLHSTTSPLYAICASNDISSMMMYRSGESLTTEVIEEAVDFRQTMAKLYDEAQKKGSWFFKPWNAEKVTDHKTGKTYDFKDAPRDLLIHDQRCWRIEDGDEWHGFKDLGEENWVMLDPIKVSILAPGMDVNGKIADHGVPAALVTSYLYQHGIVPTRTTDFQIMFLFSMGITKGKWGTLVNVLLNFRKHYQENTPISEIFPDLAEKYPAYYGKCGLKDLGERMFGYIRENQPGELLNAAFSSIPKPVVSPHDAY